VARKKRGEEGGIEEFDKPTISPMDGHFPFFKDGGQRLGMNRQHSSENKHVQKYLS